MRRVRSAASSGARMALAGAAVAVAAGWSAAQAETWQQRLGALEAGAPAKIDLGAPQLAQQTEEPIVLAPVTIEGQGEDASGPVDGYVASESTTGNKTDTTIIETPQSISVITADQMDAQAAGSLGESFRYTPGITAEQWGTDMRGYGIKIRGFDANDNSFYKDGLQLQGTNYVSFMNIDTYGAERLELLRGPASVLYGQNGPGGLINYVSKRPTAEPRYEVEVGAGSFDRFEGRFDLSGPITEDGAVQYRAIGLARESDTQIDYVEADRIFFAPALTWEGEDTTLTLLAHYQRDDAGWGTQFLPASGTVLDNPNGDIPVSRFAGEPGFDKYQVDQVAVGYQLEHRFNETFTVRQNARYAYIHNDAELVYGVGLNPADPQQRLLSRVGDESESELGSIALDNQAQAKFDTGPVAHTALLGVDFQYYDFSDVGASRSVADLDIFDPDYGAELGDAVPYEDSDHMQRQIGIYAQEQAKLFDRLVVVLGGRYDFAKSESREEVFNTESESEDSAFTGRAGLVYLFDIGLAPYASYSESFMPQLGTDAAGNPFKPEEGRQYEVGLKYQPPGWNSFVTVSLFDLVKQNVLTPDPADPANSQVQTGEIRSRGIELEGVASFDSGLDVTVAYTFLDAEITKSNAESDGGESELGNRPERTAKHSASLWADYTIPEGDFAGLGAGAGVRYIGPTFGDNFEDLKLPGYTLFDASIHYDWNDFRFQLNGSNLADKAYVASCYGKTSCFYGERRAVIGTVTYSW
jgi:iron complex outermembrane recepter protein